MTHTLVSCRPAPYPTAYQHLYVDCSCGQSWTASYWTLHFQRDAAITHNMIADAQHRDWLSLLLCYLAWGYDDALDRVQAFQERAVPAAWAWEYLLAQGPAPSP